MKTIDSTLELWNALPKTNPDDTIQVKKNGGFTAIKSYSQIKEATKQFGPVGIGWGWDVTYEIVAEMVVAHIKLWYRERSNIVNGVGGCKLYQGKENRVDDDAFKKALTDGITKSLSYLGFNSDVFLGRFDDIKYVQDTKAEFSQKDNPLSKKELDFFYRLDKSLWECTTIEELSEIYAKSKEYLDKRNEDPREQSREWYTHIMLTLEKQKQNLTSIDEV